MDVVMRRDVRSVADRSFDLIVVGGGIYGAASLLAAARAGHRALLLERLDFGGATSWNSLRILHGGLRYLQTLDLRRFRASVEARSWYVEEFPDLVEPLACLMPLYGRGLRRRATMGPALAVNEALRRRWSSVAERAVLPEGRLVTAAETAGLFPGVRREGLDGAALWYDGRLPRPQRVLIEMLRRARALGCEAFNYVEVVDWCVTDGRITGVRARDATNWTEYEFRARTVLNCAGPWAAALAPRDRALGAAFHPSLAFNLLLDRPIDSSVAVAVEPAGGGRTYFLHPMGEQTLAGTFHAPLDNGDAEPAEGQVAEFLDDLRRAVPGFDVTTDHVLRVLSGVLPARRPRTDRLAVRPLRHAAGQSGGAEGLHALVGVKYTTAPLVAARVVSELMGSQPALRGPGPAPPTRPIPSWSRFVELVESDAQSAAALLREIVSEEAVVEPDDLLLRRTDWGLDPRTRDRAWRRVHGLCPELFSPGGRP